MERTAQIESKRKTPGRNNRRLVSIEDVNMRMTQGQLGGGMKQGSVGEMTDGISGTIGTVGTIGSKQSNLP